MPGDKLPPLETEVQIDFGRVDGDAKKLQGAVKQLDSTLSATEKQFKKLEDSAKNVGVGLKGASVAGDILRTTLGFLGATSIQQVLFKFKQLIVESSKMAVALEGVEARAKAIFGDALPAVRREIELVATAAKRSSSDVLDMATSFGSLLDSVGASSSQVSQFSVQLAELAVTLGKAFPALSDQEIFEKLQAGVLGSTKGLRELGIVMKDDQLQTFALSKGIKLLTKDMTEEQKVVLRSMFLLEETTKAQEAAADSTGSFGDQVKETSADWKDLQETLGAKINSAPFQSFVQGAIALMENMLTPIQTLKDAWLGLLSIVNAVVDPSGLSQKQALGRSKSVSDANVALQAEVAARQEAAGLTLKNPGKGISSGDDDFWRRAGGGGGSEADKVTEKDILDAMKAQADLQKEFLQNRREDLKLKKELGVLTEKEARELERINRRIEFQPDIIDDATEAWREQADALEEVENKIKDINDEIIEENKRLADELKGIREESQEDAISKVEDLVRKRNDIIREARERNMAGGNAAVNGTELGRIDDELAGFSAEDRAEGERRAKLSSAETIEEEKQRKIDAAIEASNAKVEELEKELAQEEANRDAIVRMEEEKRMAVVTSLQSRTVEMGAQYALQNAATKAHVDFQIGEFNRLQAAMRGAARASTPRFAAGGLVAGSGTDTSDNIDAKLSPGEFVVRAAAVRKVGVANLHRLNSLTLDVPRSGPVSTSYDHRKHVEAAFHFHGEAAKVAADPAMMRWHLRKAA